MARTQEVLSDTYVKRLMGWRSSVFHNVNAHQQVQEHPPTRLGVVTKLSDIAKWPFHRTSPVLFCSSDYLLLSINNVVDRRILEALVSLPLTVAACVGCFPWRFLK